LACMGELVVGLPPLSSEENKSLHHFDEVLPVLQKS
jgi:hypothetical protein